jgi:hypothetical protein
MRFAFEKWFALAAISLAFILTAFGGSSHGGSGADTASPMTRALLFGQKLGGKFDIFNTNSPNNMVGKGDIHWDGALKRWVDANDKIVKDQQAAWNDWFRQHKTQGFGFQPRDGDSEAAPHHRRRRPHTYTTTTNGAEKAGRSAVRVSSRLSRSPAGSGAGGSD